MDTNDADIPLEQHNTENNGVPSQEVQMCTISTDFPNDATVNLSDLHVVDSQRSHSTNSPSFSGAVQADGSTKLPYLFINRPTSFILPPLTSQPLRISSRQSPISLNVVTSQPQSLFIQALSKLNESSISLAVLNHLRNMSFSPNTPGVNKVGVGPKSAELTPPNSLMSAPPSYSFVLRQIAARRRPRLMGTFIPSPSFVQHTPPPNYATAFDIYVDNLNPPLPPRVYHFGFTPMPIVCPACGYTGLTLVTSKITICTHLCAIILCIFCCWVCAPLPYVLSSCKDVYHYCRNCRNFLGMYCPTNPEQQSYL